MVSLFDQHKLPGTLKVQNKIHIKVISNDRYCLSINKSIEILTEFLLIMFELFVVSSQPCGKSNRTTGCGCVVWNLTHKHRCTKRAWCIYMILATTIQFYNNKTKHIHPSIFFRSRTLHLNEVTKFPPHIICFTIDHHSLNPK